MGIRNWLRGLAAAAIALGSWGAVAPGLANAAEPIVLHRGNGAEPDSLDPHKATGSWENNIVGDMLIGLMTDDAMARPVPGAAVSYETSADGLVWTFKLREGMVWSDGVPVTADDFVFALQRINSSATNAQYASLTHVVKNAAAALRGDVPVTDIGIRAIDPMTVEITLEHPAPYLTELLTHYTFFPVPKHVVERVGDDWVKPGNYVSNGPYVLKEWQPNSYVHVVRNPTFYDNANVQIDEVYYYSSEDQVASLKRFRAGEFDLNAGIPSQQIDFIRAELGDYLRIAEYVTVNYIVFNLTRPTFQDARVRTAISMLIDRETITDRILKAGETPAYSIVPASIPNYPVKARLAWAEMPMAERIERAKALLAEAGFGPGNPLRFEFSHPSSTDAKRIATALQQMWRAGGVEVELIPGEVRVTYNNLRSQNYDVGWAGWIADFPDAKNFLYLAESRSGEMNYSKYDSVAFNDLVIASDNEADAAKRGELLRQAEQQLLDDAPMAPVLFSVSRNLVNSYVKGFEDNLTNIHRTRFMRIEGPRTPPGEQAPPTADNSSASVDAPADEAGEGFFATIWGWIVGAWNWFLGLLCSWFGIACS